MKNLRPTRFRLLLLLVLVVLLLGALLLGIGDYAGHSPVVSSHSVHSSTAMSMVETRWTCSMHPSVMQETSGSCPICGMHLVSVTPTRATDPLSFELPPEARAFGDIKTTIVTKQKPTKILYLTGQVAVNQEDVYAQTAHIPGRIERMFVTYTGDHVKKGQLIAYAYSPELLRAQEELIEAQRMKKQYPQLYTAAYEKLRLHWKMNDRFIRSILKAKQPKSYLPMLSDHTGIVTRLYAQTGDHVGIGAPLFEISRLKSVWVWWHIDEDDAPWVSVGDSVFFSLKQHANKTFKGSIAYIEPLIASGSYAVRARLRLPNSDLSIKPGGIALGRLHHKWQGTGVVWLPNTALLWTGKRAIVYVEDSAGGFHWRSIELGAEVGGGYLVKNGIKAGERIATHGLFTLDAAAQIQGKASMLHDSPDKKN